MNQIINKLFDIHQLHRARSWLRLAYLDLARNKIWSFLLLFQILLFSSLFYATLGWGINAEKAMYSNVMDSTDFQLSVSRIDIPDKIYNESLLDIKTFIEAEFNIINQVELLLTSSTFENQSDSWYGSLFLNKAVQTMIKERVTVFRGSIDFSDEKVVVSRDFASSILIQNQSGGYRSLTVGDWINITTNSVNDQKLSFKTVEIAGIINLEQSKLLTSSINTENARLENILSNYAQDLILISDSTLNDLEFNSLLNYGSSMLLISLDKKELVHYGNSALGATINGLAWKIEKSFSGVIISNFIEDLSHQLAEIYLIMRLTNSIVFIPPLILSLVLILQISQYYVENKRRTFGRWELCGVHQASVPWIVTLSVFFVLPIGLSGGLLIGHTLLNFLVLSRFTWEIAQIDLFTLIVTIILTIFLFFIVYYWRTKKSVKGELRDLLTDSSSENITYLEEKRFERIQIGLLLFLIGIIALIVCIIDQKEFMSLEFIYFDLVRMPLYLTGIPCLWLGSVFLIYPAFYMLLSRFKLFLHVVYGSKSRLIWKRLQVRRHTESILVLILISISLTSFALFSLDSLATRSSIESKLIIGGNIRLLTQPTTPNSSFDLNTAFPEIQNISAISFATGIIGGQEFEIYGIEVEEYLNSLTPEVLSFQGISFRNTIMKLKNSSNIITSTELARRNSLNIGSKPLIQVGSTIIQNISVAAVLSFVPGISGLTSSEFGDSFILIKRTEIKSYVETCLARDFIVRLNNTSNPSTVRNLLMNYDPIKILDAIDVETLQKSDKNYATFGIVNILLLEFGVGLIAGIIGFTITLNSLVKHRRSEFGILMTYGATRKYVLLQTSIELIFIVLIAGGVGIVVGWFDTILLNWIIEMILNEWFWISVPANFNISLAIVILGFAVVFCLLVSLAFTYNNISWIKLIGELKRD